MTQTSQGRGQRANLPSQKSLAPPTLVTGTPGKLPVFKPPGNTGT